MGSLGWYETPEAEGVAAAEGGEGKERLRQTRAQPEAQPAPDVTCSRGLRRRKTPAWRRYSGEPHLLLFEAGIY